MIYKMNRQKIPKYEKLKILDYVWGSIVEAANKLTPKLKQNEKLKAEILEVKKSLNHPFGIKVIVYPIKDIRKFR